MKPLVIGLTGGIGVGKSSVAKLLADLGAEVVVGDELGKIALEKFPELIQAIRQKFGEVVFDGSGNLIRKKLGELVFGSADNTKWLTDLTFPKIFSLWTQRLKQSNKPVIVLDAALIFEWGIENEFDILLVITTDEKTIFERVAHDQRFTAEQLRARMSLQIPQEIKIKKTDYVIQNSHSADALHQQVNIFWKNYVESKLKNKKTNA